jgi:DNA mismatch repair ATPase MutS
LWYRDIGGNVMGNGERKYKIGIGIFIVLAIIVAYGSYLLGIGVNSIYFFGFIVSFIFVIFCVKLHRKYSYIRMLNEIKREWGKPKERKRNFEVIGELHRLIKEQESNRFYIDDQTFEDLNMKEIYALMDRTLTTSGEQMLFHILRTPLMESSSINKRKKVVNFFQESKDEREQIQMYLRTMGRQMGSSITSFLWGTICEEKKLKWLYNVMFIVSLAAMGSSIFIGYKALILIFMIFSINQYLHYKIKDRISGSISTMKYINNLLDTAYNISVMKNEELSDYRVVLSKLASACETLRKKGKNRIYEGVNELYEYMNVLLLVEERKYYAVLDEIMAHKDEIKRIFQLVGEIDALISIASYREDIKKYVEPEFIREGRKIEIINARHPLIRDAVGNSITIIEKGIVITGSNMSGKSTFLRTLGLNALLAQTICTCIADFYSGSFLKVMTSISQGDNLVGGKSYYLAEAEALLRIISSSEDIIPTFCIVDEIFRGTNPIERASASAEILRYLEDNNCLVIVATHDIEITEMIKDIYRFFYFSEDINDDGLHFDYLLKEGISRNRNAVKLMRYLGYPDEIVEKTRERVNRII